MEHIENDEQFGGLTVNKGVNQPPVVNPYLRPRRRRVLPNAGELVEGILKGDITTLARAVTLVESLSPEHQAIAQEVIEKCLPHSGNSRRIGITGVPGAGKSTSIDVFGLHVLKRGGKLAVLAIDPSRPEWRNFRYTPMPSSAPVRRQDHSEVWPGKHARP